MRNDRNQIYDSSHLPYRDYLKVKQRGEVHEVTGAAEWQAVTKIANRP